MSLEPLIGLAIAGAAVPLIKLLTSRLRRFVRHRVNDGPIRRILLTPLGYTKRARKEAAMHAVLDDYHLRSHRSHELGQRNGSSESPSSTEPL
jgi:hypothetical protein